MMCLRTFSDRHAKEKIRTALIAKKSVSSLMQDKNEREPMYRVSKKTEDESGVSV